jgi:dTDP-4-amino-4,6-dideoxygalactose transaminase
VTDLLPRTDQPRIAFARTSLAPEAAGAVAAVLASGWLTTGPQVQEFEKEMGAYLGAEDAIAVSSCTAAIELALRALRLPPGSKVLASTITFCGAVNAILHAGLVPVLVDVNPFTLMPDAETTAKAVARAGGVDAMTIVHFAGYPAPVHAMAEAAGLPLNRVIEDAAHAFGAKLGDQPIGTVSGATCFSFYATKNLPVGEGGMVTTADPDIAESVRRGRLHGMTKDAWGRYLPGANWRYTVETPGLKANMTDIQAAIGRAQLPKFDEWQARRRDLVARYDTALSGMEGLQLPARPTQDEGTHAWHLYVLRVGEGFSVTRDIFMQQLAAMGVDCSVHFIPLHTMPHMRDALGEGADPALFPEAERALEEIVSLPLYPGLSDDDVDRVCAAVAEVATPGFANNQGGTR